MSYLYRQDRITNICNDWGMEKVHDLMASWPIPQKKNKHFLLSVKSYISKALDIFPYEDDHAFVKAVDAARENRKNITPNGAVVPKKEYLLEYNILLREWTSLINIMTRNNPKLLSLFRLTPNIRIKFAKELEENIDRELNTSYPHSDAWVEGPWGMNTFVPLFGDTENNTLLYYQPIDKSKFSEDYLATAKTYQEMQWVLERYEKIEDIVPQKGKIYISDYAMIHNTERKENAGTRISIDTTVFVGNHQPHQDRLTEYSDKPPAFGTEEIINVFKSEHDDVNQKKTTFSHYTSGSTKRISLK